MKHLTILITLLFCGCAQMNISDYKSSEPTLDFQKHFVGHHEGSGAFFDRFGRMKVQFTIKIDGLYDGETLKLNEVLTYDTGEIVKRFYEIRKTEDGKFIGKTEDIIGEAVILTSGNAANWKYELRQKIGESFWNLKFDDWMFLNSDGSITNRAQASFWGLKVGEVFMVLRKIT